MYFLYYAQYTCHFIPNNYAKEISLPKDLDEEDIEKIKEKYKDSKSRKAHLNINEFGTDLNCSQKEKLYSNNCKPRTIKDYCVKIKIDWLGNIIEFNGLKL